MKALAKQTGTVTFYEWPGNVAADTVVTNSGNFALNFTLGASINAARSSGAVSPSGTLTGDHTTMWTVLVHFDGPSGGVTLNEAFYGIVYDVTVPSYEIN